MTSEPVLIAGAIQALIAVFVSLQVFVLTDIQQATVMAAVFAVISVIVRHQVTPVSKL